jgi:hypothetical protein
MQDGAKQATTKRLKLRDRLFPDAQPIVFDTSNRATKGYSQVPRVVPLVARLINDIGGTANAGPLYQVLWAQDWGQGIVEVRSFRGLLYEAGYNGKGGRVERTWQERIKILVDQGFIKTAKRGLDDHAFVLLVDPHIAVLKLESASLKAQEKKLLDLWFPEFRTVAEQWGVDLDEYRARIAGELQAAVAT